MARGLAEQTREFQAVMVDLLKKYQFRDRNETVAYGLSVSQAYALRALAEDGSLAMGALARALGLSQSAATRAVDPLASRGLVHRVAGAADRRVCKVALTRRGRSLWERLEGELLAIDEAVLRTLRPSEREVLIRAIAQLAEATDAWREAKRR